MSHHPRTSVFRRLAGNERGATAVEYGLILALVTLASLAALSDLASTTVGVWTKIATKVTTAS